MERRLTQRRRHSLVEACLSTAIGFGISYLMNIFVMSAFFGIVISTSQNLAVTSLFTVVSIARGYGVRRLFNWMHYKEIL